MMAADPTVTTDPASLYVSAGRSFVRLVEQIDQASWDQLSLGDWDLRTLVGHTSRAFVTVIQYLDRPTTVEDVASPQQYYALASQNMVDPEAIAERARLAGSDLGDQPADAVGNLLAQAASKLSGVNSNDLIMTIVGGMTVANYLPTRIFELVVHSFDITTATGIAIDFSRPVIEKAVELAALTAVALDNGPAVLMSLTGRRSLPPGFSIVG